MLAKGASPYDAAKMLGDTIETIERHYTPFVPELRERVRRILDSESGLESGKIARQSEADGFTVTNTSQSRDRIQ